MTTNEQVLKNFNDKESFMVFVETLENQGYVIDGKEESGLSFSSTQIEHINQKVYDILCNTHEIASYIDNLHVTGSFYQEHGAYYIAFDGDRYEFESAKQLLNEYIRILD